MAVLYMETDHLTGMYIQDTIFDSGMTISFKFVLARIDLQEHFPNEEIKTF